MIKVTFKFSYLEFNVPFQRKYGHIKDDVTSETCIWCMKSAKFLILGFQGNAATYLRCGA